MNSGDTETESSLRHDSFTSVWPQSGEVVDRIAADKVGAGDRPTGETVGVHGGSTARVSMIHASPLPIGTPILSVSGSGNTFTFVARLTWREDYEYCLIGIVEFRDGLVAKQTMYWAPAEGAAPWRRDD